MNNTTNEMKALIDEKIKAKFGSRTAYCGKRHLDYTTLAQVLNGQSENRKIVEALRADFGSFDLAEFKKRKAI